VGTGISQDGVTFQPIDFSAQFRALNFPALRFGAVDFDDLAALRVKDALSDCAVDGRIPSRLQ
jgi:hypothetical protein